MKKIPLGTYKLRRKNGQFTNLKNIVREIVQWFKVSIGVAAILTLTFTVGNAAAAGTTVLHIRTISPGAQDFPIMDKIGDCESGTRLKNGHAVPNSRRQFYPDGQLVEHGNKNGSVDIGEYGINNQVWGKKALSLGFDIYHQPGNKAMAYWIAENYGTSPWYSSASCWK